MKVVMISQTALAAAPYEIMRCLNKYTSLKVRWVANRTRYADGRIFPNDLLWDRDRSQCIRAMVEADVVHIHNEPCEFAEKHIRGKSVLAQFHSCPKRASYDRLRKRAQAVFTLEQPMQKRVYSGLRGLPNLIDPEDYRPRQAKGVWRPVIAFAPTNTWSKEMLGSKGSEDVIRILKRFEGRAVIDVFSNLPYLMNLKRKKYADIIVDDVVGETFHRTALEGACFGKAVLTGDDSYGFMYTRLDSLEKNLDRLLSDRTLLQEYQRRSREWVVNDWHPRNLVNLYLEAYSKCGRS